jgi:hypothetical protein
VGTIDSETLDEGDSVAVSVRLPPGIGAVVDDVSAIVGVNLDTVSVVTAELDPT